MDSDNSSQSVPELGTLPRYLSKSHPHPHPPTINKADEPCKIIAELSIRDDYEQLSAGASKSSHRRRMKSHEGGKGSKSAGKPHRSRRHGSRRHDKENENNESSCTIFWTTRGVKHAWCNHSVLHERLVCSVGLNFLIWIHWQARQRFRLEEGAETIMSINCYVIRNPFKSKEYPE